MVFLLTKRINNMRYIVIISLFTAFAINVNAQSDREYIDRREFYLIRARADTTGTIKAHLITSLPSAETLFGPPNSATKEFNSMIEIKLTHVRYDDGLILNIPDPGKGSHLAFRVTSDKYFLVLGNGKEIKVGMSAIELESMFPKSYAKRRHLTGESYPGDKYVVSVYFYTKLENEIIWEEDSQLIFVFTKNGILESFYSWEPM